MRRGKFQEAINDVNRVELMLQNYDNPLSHKDYEAFKSDFEQFKKEWKSANKQAISL